MDNTSVAATLITSDADLFAASEQKDTLRVTRSNNYTRQPCTFVLCFHKCLLRTARLFDILQAGLRLFLSHHLCHYFNLQAILLLCQLTAPFGSRRLLYSEDG